MVKSLFSLLAMFVLLSACSNASFEDNPLTQAPAIKTETASGKLLRSLPKASRRAVVAVYEFTDQTGQHKPSDNFAEFSRAVTQGGMAILSESLTKAGNGGWFRVIERGGLDNLLRERQIIAATREQYTNAKTPLPPMLFAGMLLEGGIISYETNTLTGGFGARYLGIGGHTQYRQDIVTIYLRAINVQNGEVLLSTNASKTIFSTALSGSAFEFVAFDELLEIETGFTLNEPPQFAVRQAIESGVYSLIMEGILKGIWQFDDEAAGQHAVRQYLQMRDGEAPAAYQQATLHKVSGAQRAEPASAASVPSFRSERDKVAESAFVRPERKNVPYEAPVASDFVRPQQPAMTSSETVPQLDPQSEPLRGWSGNGANSLKRPFNQESLQYQLKEAQQDAASQAGAEEESSYDQQPRLRRPTASGRSYQRIPTSEEDELYCDSQGCYPFNPSAE